MSLEDRPDRGIAFEVREEDDDEKLFWYALHVRANCERAVRNQLEYQGYELYLPTVHVLRRWSDRVKHLDIPLFAGYLFCRFDARNPLPILSVSGVVQIVGMGNSPVPVAENIIRDIKTVQKSGLWYSNVSHAVSGQRVVVERGPLTGVQGVLVETREANRLAISISMLQRSLVVEVDANWIRVLPSDVQVIPSRLLREPALVQ